MCSIAGFISSQPLHEDLVAQLCRALLFYGSARGEQSTGIYIQDTTLKRAMPPTDFVRSPEFQTLVSRPANIALLHTRQPTIGGRGDEHAQPFAVEGNRGHFVSVHNGHVSNWEKLKTDHAIDIPSGVDSELFPRVLANEGIFSIAPLLQSATGSSTVAFIHEKKRLYLCRDGNPVSILFVRFTDGNKIAIFASTDDIVMQAARYVWLLDNHYRCEPLLTNRQLYRLEPTELRTIGPVATWTRSYVSGEPKGRWSHDPTDDTTYFRGHGYPGIIGTKGETKRERKAREARERDLAKTIETRDRRMKGQPLCGSYGEYDSHRWPDRDVSPPPGTNLQRLLASERVEANGTVKETNGNGTAPAGAESEGPDDTPYGV